MLFLFSCIELRLIIGHNLHHSSKALRSRTQYDIVVKPSLIKRMQICKSTSFFSPPQTWWDLSKVFWDTQELKLTDAETYACTSLTSHCQQVLPEFLHITAALILSLCMKFFGLFLIVWKTSLICIVSMMFCFFSNIVKNIEINVFFQNIAEASHR